jgi:hypothetical protein
MEKRIREESLRLCELAKMDLPGLENLLPQDIVSLRRDEEAFETWRVGLSRALDHVSRLDADFLDKDADRAVIRDELCDVARKTAEKVDSSGFLKNLRRGARSFSLGAVGALAIASLRSPLPAMISGAVSLAADLLLAFLSRESVTGKQALLRHFAIFEP